jgi:hypothetical protein
MQAIVGFGSHGEAQRFAGHGALWLKSPGNLQIACKLIGSPAATCLRQGFGTPSAALTEFSHARAVTPGRRAAGCMLSRRKRLSGHGSSNPILRGKHDRPDHPDARGVDQEDPAGHPVGLARVTSIVCLRRPEFLTMPHARRKTMKPIKPVVAVSALLISASAVIPAAAQSYPLECAQRDVESVTQLEQLGEAQSVPGEILYEAFRVLTRARKACSQGRTALALALYDSIFKTSLAGQMQTPDE